MTREPCSTLDQRAMISKNFALTQLRWVWQILLSPNSGAIYSPAAPITFRGGGYLPSHDVSRSMQEAAHCILSVTRCKKLHDTSRTLRYARICIVRADLGGAVTLPTITYHYLTAAVRLKSRVIIRLLRPALPL